MSTACASSSTDVDDDGGKLILTAGAPTITGNDEERMLLALRKIVDVERAIPIRIGVNRGAVFAGDIGPWYRRTYTVMGDAVNLAARLMAKAEPGQIYATAEVLDALGHPVRDQRARAVHGQGQGQARAGVGRRGGARVAHPRRERAAAADRTRRRSSPSCEPRSLTRRTATVG